MYKVIEKFADLQDRNYIYEVGDEYPRKGYLPSPKRIEELAGNKNRLRTPLIKEIEPMKYEDTKVGQLENPVEEAQAEDKEKAVVPKRRKKTK